MKRIALALVVGFGVAVAQADEFDVVDYGIFRSIDPLAQRDEWGTTHQTPHVNATDFAPRYAWRWEYYFKARQQLLLDPGYVGSLQTALRRLGYYCGPVDGVFTLSSELAYDAASKSVVLKSPSVDNVSVSGQAQAYTQQINAAAAVLATQLLTNYPIYTFKPEQLQFAGVNYEPGTITILTNGIRVQIVEK